MTFVSRVVGDASSSFILVHIREWVSVTLIFVSISSTPRWFQDESHRMVLSFLLFLLDTTPINSQLIGSFILESNHYHHHDLHHLKLNSSARKAEWNIKENQSPLIIICDRFNWIRSLWHHHTSMQVSFRTRPLHRSLYTIWTQNNYNRCRHRRLLVGWDVLGS